MRRGLTTPSFGKEKRSLTETMSITSWLWIILIYVHIAISLGKWSEMLTWTIPKLDEYTRLALEGQGALAWLIRATIWLTVGHLQMCFGTHSLKPVISCLVKLRHGNCLWNDKGVLGTAFIKPRGSIDRIIEMQ